MVKLNKSTRYALYAMVELAADPGAVLTSRHIADKYRISEHHVAKVMQQLVRAGLVRSIRGINGGFQIARSAKEVTMFDIVRLFEPQLPKERCILADYDVVCHLADACRIGEVFDEIREQAASTLQSITIATLIAPKKLA